MSELKFWPTIQRLEKLMPELLQVSNHPSDHAESNCLKLLQSAARRWVILRSLYDRDSNFFVELETGNFNCADWLKKFKQAKLDYQSVTLDSWLFDESIDSFKTEFVTALKSRYNLESADINNLLKKRIFAVSERTFRNQFTQLAKLKNRLLKKEPVNQLSTAKRQIHNFSKVSTDAIAQFLETEKTSNDDDLVFLDFFTNEVSDIAELFFNKIKGEQRLFIHHEYVVHENMRDKSTDTADRLKRIWKITPTPPIKIIYDSASLKDKGKYVVYPVCLYYYQRAYYLCAYGERPQPNQKQPLIGWYNYRLERITKINKLSWETADLPFSKSEIIDRSEAYSPDYIQAQLESAYGFDFYQEAKLMLLRFDADFASRYIDNSFRHSEFNKLDSYQEAIDLVKQEKPSDIAPQRWRDRHQILTRVEQYPHAAYYTLNYRHDDNNVIMRLRAWGQNVEVILPQEMRQRMKKDIAKTSQFYQDSTEQ